MVRHGVLNIDKKIAGLIFVGTMDIFYDVLFEISNEDRHKILIQVGDEAMNVTQLAKKFDLSLTETSRHLSRTTNAGLVKKDVEYI